MDVNLTRDGLVARLAAVSHATYMRQKAEDMRKEGKDEAEIANLSPEVTDHDRERAEDTVRELERLGIWPRPGD